MSGKTAVKLFEDKRIRTVWSEDFEDWYFSIIDVIEVLTESSMPRRYWTDLKRKLTAEGSQLYEDIVQLKMPGNDGKMYKTDVASTKQLLRLIQSIPSPKAEPFKQWLAEVGNDRLNETTDPELAITRALRYYRNLGYSDEWIHLRLQSIDMRKDLTDEWDKSGIKNDFEYAILTNLMTKEWSGKSVKEYKQHKGLKKESLRDNMSNMEIVLNMLAEESASEIHKSHPVSGFDETAQVAKKGASVAGNARREIEKNTGKSVVSKKNAMELNRGTKKELE
jgi:hypothetical protein